MCGPKNWMNVACMLVAIGLGTGCSSPDLGEPVDMPGYGVVFEAAERGEWFVVETAIAEGAMDADWMDTSGRTLLHYAAAAGQRGVVYTLLDEGQANPNLADPSGKTPLDFAVENGHTQVVELLKQHGATD